MTGLCRLTSASGIFYRRQPDVQEKYTLAMAYTKPYDITRKHQLQEVEGHDWPAADEQHV
jgi:hypothetical protein